MPAILSGVALSFARAVGEFGRSWRSWAPSATPRSSTYIFSQIETDNTASAAVVSVVLLVVSLLILLGIRLIERRGARHRAG